MEIYIKKFNELTVDELYYILKLRVDVFVVEQNCPYNEIDGNDIKCYHVFYKENDKILSYLRIIPKGITFDELSIGRVAVSKNYRKLGLARKMLSFALCFIKDNLKENTIKIAAQTYLTNFYESLGFHKISEPYLEDGIPHVNMIKESR